MSWGSKGGIEGTGAGNINLTARAGGVGNVPQEWNYTDVQRYAEYGRGKLFRPAPLHRKWAPRRPSAYWYQQVSSWTCEDPGLIAYQRPPAGSGPTVPSAVRRLLRPAGQNCTGVACGQNTVETRLGRAPRPPMSATGRPLVSTSDAARYAASAEGRAALRPPLAALPPVDASNATLLQGAPIAVVTPCGCTAAEGHTMQFDGAAWTTSDLNRALDDVLEANPRIIDGSLTSCGPLVTNAVLLTTTAPPPSSSTARAASVPQGQTQESTPIPDWMVDAHGVQYVDGDDTSACAQGSLVRLGDDTCCSVVAPGCVQGALERLEVAAASGDAAGSTPKHASQHAETTFATCLVDLTTAVSPSSPAAPPTPDAALSPSTFPSSAYIGLVYLHDGVADGQEYNFVYTGAFATTVAPTSDSPNSPSSPALDLFVALVLDVETYTAVVNPSTGARVEQLQFDAVGQQASLVWVAETTQWILSSTQAFVVETPAASSIRSAASSSLHFPPSNPARLEAVTSASAAAQSLPRSVLPPHGGALYITPHVQRRIVPALPSAAGALPVHAGESVCQFDIQLDVHNGDLEAPHRIQLLLDFSGGRFVVFAPATGGSSPGSGEARLDACALEHPPVWPRAVYRVSTDGALARGVQFDGVVDSPSYDGGATDAALWSAPLFFAPDGRCSVTVSVLSTDLHGAWIDGAHLFATYVAAEEAAAAAVPVVALRAPPLPHDGGLSWQNVGGIASAVACSPWILYAAPDGAPDADGSDWVHATTLQRAFALVATLAPLGTIEIWARHGQYRASSAWYAAASQHASVVSCGDPLAHQCVRLYTGFAGTERARAERRVPEQSPAAGGLQPSLPFVLLCDDTVADHDSATLDAFPPISSLTHHTLVRAWRNEITAIAPVRPISYEFS